MNRSELNGVDGSPVIQVQEGVIMGEVLDLTIPEANEREQQNCF